MVCQISAQKNDGRDSQFGEERLVFAAANVVTGLF